MSVASTANLPATSASQEFIDARLTAELACASLQEGQDFWVTAYGNAADLVIEGIGDKARQVLASIKSLAPVLYENGWFIAMERENRLQLEPFWGRRAKVRNTLYHVTRRANLAGILAEGLMPRPGGSTYLYRSYPPRVYVSRSVAGIKEFVAASAENGLAINDPVTLRIDISKLGPDTRFYVDELAKYGVWTYSAIPVNSITPV